MSEKRSSRNHDQILQSCLRFFDVNEMPLVGGAEQIVRFFFSVDEHLSLEDIEEYARSHDLGMGRDGARRTMDQLVECGFALRKRFDDQRAYYEHRHLGEHHDHLYCLRCGRIIEFYSPRIEEMQVREAGAHGFHAFSHRMEINGLCDACFGENSRKLISLAMVGAGGRFHVAEIVAKGSGGGSGFQRRLLDLGFLPEAKGEVISNDGGRVVLSLGKGRIALGRGQAQRIMVVLLN